MFVNALSIDTFYFASSPYRCFACSSVNFQRITRQYCCLVSLEYRRLQRPHGGWSRERARLWNTAGQAALSETARLKRTATCRNAFPPLATRPRLAPSLLLWSGRWTRSEPVRWTWTVPWPTCQVDSQSVVFAPCLDHWHSF